MNTIISELKKYGKYSFAAFVYFWLFLELAMIIRNGIDPSFSYSIGLNDMFILIVAIIQLEFLFAKKSES